MPGSDFYQRARSEHHPGVRWIRWTEAKLITQVTSGDDYASSLAEVGGVHGEVAEARRTAAGI